MTIRTVEESDRAIVASARERVAKGYSLPHPDSPAGQAIDAALTREEARRSPKLAKKLRKSDMSRYLDQLTGDATGPSVDELRASFTRTRGTPLPPVPSHSSEQYLGRLHGVNIAGSGSTIGERIANGHEMAVKALAAAERRRAALSHPYAKSALELAEARARKKGRSYVTETDLNKSMSQLTKSLGPVAAPPRPPWVALVRKHPETSDPGIRVSR